MHVMLICRSRGQVAISEYRALKVMGSEENTLIEILEENAPIDLAKYINYVSAPQAGAIATFSGTTRDTFEGKTVVELRYEAYVPMAIRQLKSICSSARLSWNIHSIAVAHRLGSVPVGETSVFVAVSAVHRCDALDASSSACFCCCTSLPRLNQKLTLLPCSTTSLLCGCRVQTLACCEATSSRVQLPFPCFCYSQLVLLQMRAVNAAMEDFCCHGSSFSSLQQLQVAFRR